MDVGFAQRLYDEAKSRRIGKEQELGSARGSARSAGSFYEESGQKLGLPAAQERQQRLRSVLRGTEQALRGVENSVTGRTQGSLVTEAQRARLANIERQPLSEQFREQQGALGEEQSLFQQLLSEAGQRAGLEYQSQQDRLGALERALGLASEEEQSGLSLFQAAQQAAEERRRFDEQTRLEREKIRASNRTSPIDLAGILASLGASAIPAPTQSLESILGKGGGNKAKSKSKAKPGKSYNPISDEGAKNLGNAVRSRASSILGGLGNRLKSNARIFGF